MNKYSVLFYRNLIGIFLAGIRGWAMENRVYAEDPFKASRKSDQLFFAQSPYSTVLRKKMK
jgi:hypothetical protein